MTPRSARIRSYNLLICSPKLNQLSYPELSIQNYKNQVAMLLLDKARAGINNTMGRAGKRKQGEIVHGLYIWCREMVYRHYYDYWVVQYNQALVKGCFPGRE